MERIPVYDLIGIVKALRKLEKENLDENLLDLVDAMVDGPLQDFNLLFGTPTVSLFDRDDPDFDQM